MPERVRPVLCPFCGLSGTLVVDMTEWDATPQVPMEWKYRAGSVTIINVLKEHRCDGCGNSFWT